MASKMPSKTISKPFCGKENYSKGVVIKAAEDGSIAVDAYTVLSYGVQRSAKLQKTSKNVFVLA